jgi:rare lipoprotein A
MKNSIIVFSTAMLLFVITGFTTTNSVAPVKKEFKKTALIAVAKDSTETDEPDLTLYKKDVMATYYADKFNGHKTSSGQKFHNSKYTAAHMKLPFGTKVRVTNEKTGRFVDVTVNDRGPFSKKLEIDLTKKAFMEIAPTKGCGSFKCKIEIIDDKA